MTKKNKKSSDAIGKHRVKHYQEERYVIRLRNRETGKIGYIAGVPVPTDHDDEMVIAMERDGLRVYDNENRVFESFEEASKFPYPIAEIAASVIRGLPETKHIDFEVVPIPWVVN